MVADLVVAVENAVAANWSFVVVFIVVLAVCLFVIVALISFLVPF